ncbi:MAG: gluconokinase [Bacteroidia bacterium]|nr:gluconokinase [Bacteroidia bacterium]
MSPKVSAPVVILMGVSGSGKSTIGQALSLRMGWAFRDGDDFHPPANISKMQAGIPLTDADRLPWLHALADAIRDCRLRGEAAVFACSALRAQYREILRQGDTGVVFVWLKGDFELIQARLQARSGHFMPTALLRSQFEALEAPEDAFEADIAAPPAEVVEAIARHLGV